MNAALEALVEEINRQLGDRPFYTLPELSSIGIFGSLQSTRKILKEGKLTYFKVSPRRCVVLRTDLLEFLRKNIGAKEGCK